MKPETIRKQHRLYRFIYLLTVPLIRLLFGARVSGRERIPEGPAIVCANHSNLVDPFLLGWALTVKRKLHFAAKIELFRKRLLGRLLYGIGTFPVNRAERDLSAVRSMMTYLRAGEKVGIFPEGTRVSEDDAVHAKTGAVRVAEKLDVPIVPVFIPRRKRMFRRVHIVIGEPYRVNPERKKLTPEEFTAQTDALMEKIKSLRPED